MGIGLVDPILPVLAPGPRRVAEPGRAAVHELLRDHRRLDARHRLRLQPHRRRARRCSRGLVLVDRVQRARRRVRLDRARSSASAPAGASATRSSSPPRSPVIVGAASGGVGGAIILYEAALGLGIASGPLLGGLLGGISWRGPFFGTAALMAIGFVAIARAARGRRPQPARKVVADRPAAGAAPPRPADRRPRRALLQLRLLHAARLHAVPAAHRRARARASCSSAGACCWRSSRCSSRRGSSAASASCRRSARCTPRSPPILLVMGVGDRARRRVLAVRA